MPRWLAILLGLFRPPATPTPTPTPTPPPPPPNDVVGQLLVLINRRRAVSNLGLLHADDRLSLAAQGHADHMARLGSLGHFGIGNGTPQGRARAAGYPAAETVGEVVAWNQPTPEEVVESWMRSPGHREIILGSQHKALGAGMARASDGSPYWCGVLGEV